MNRKIGERRRPWRARATAQLAAAAAIALVAAACGGAGADGGGGEGEGDTTGVTEDTIKLGSTQPLTGPAAPGYSKIATAMEAYFEHVNAEGGIHGRRIDMVILDDGYDPSRTAEQTRRLIEQERVFALLGALGTPTHSQVLDYVRDSRIPDLFVSSGSLAWNQPDRYPGTFGWQTDYTREGKVLASYIKEHFPDQTVCSFGQNDDLGGDGVKGVEIILGEDALKRKVEYSPVSTDVAPQIGNLQAAGCEVVVGFTIPGFTALALGTAAQLGFSPQWVLSSVGADPVALQGYLGENAAALTQGIIAGNYLPMLSDTDNTWVQMFTDIHEKYGDGSVLDYTTLHGYALAYAGAQALVAAGENPTRESLVEAVSGGLITMGPATTPYAFAEGNHAGMTGVMLTQLDNLDLTPLTPPLVTDTGDGPVEEYAGELEEAPANGVPQVS
jgi:ABC-type branched-subunit amino acid transport system substrate-binding protein